MEWPSNCPKTLSSLTIILTIITTLFFFFIFSPSNPPSKTPHRILLTTPPPPPSSCLPLNYTNINGIFNYFYPHFCIFNSQLSFSLPFLLFALFLQFYVLIKTAQDHFSVVVTKVANQLRLSPSMGAVTLLALGNGAPDVFASVAAVRGGHPRTGFGAILSAGTFVSAFVVGFVGIYAAPFSVDPAPFIRDVMFYLVAALFLFYVYLSAEIYLWQAVGFVGFYLFFVGIVFWMDFGIGREKGRSREEGRLVHDGVSGSGVMEMDCESGDFSKRLERGKEQNYGFWRGGLGKVLQVWKIPVSVLLKLTIPETSPSEWNRFYQSANVALCPLALLYSCKSFMALDHPISFLLPNIHFPLWSVVLFGSCSLATLHYLVEKGPPKTEQLSTVLVAFVMSVFWISTVAGELLNCLEALGIILKLPASLLGLTVLAWGNSVGDLVADVAVAKAGQPAMAMAGCFAGPMFNMLFGLGTALVIQTADVFPEAYELHFHVSIVVAFIFLLMSLMGSLLVVTWHRFRVPRFWGFCLVGLYVIFVITSLIIATFSA